ncbi:hypothetical protein [Haloferula sp. A504]|uniref:hypothetical protein n=1 Tax=Haloferula sp. A504 TaxID=3373601 RepID=UPI0031C6C351|nr:hypothetical protein [Verrucomicrobiaceae bacterium E54]
MKWVVGMIFASLPLLAAEEIEGEVWYDAEGEVVFVEGPAAESSTRPFVPAWERRARDQGEGRFEFRYDHRYRQRRSWYGSHGWYGGWYGYPGWSVCRPAYPTPYRPGFSIHYPKWGASVIIR